MTGDDIRRATLDEIEEMVRRGEVYHNSDAPEGPSLGEDFWENAVRQEPPPRDTIVLPVERTMMEWFKAQYEDYPRRMNEILRAHMAAAVQKKAG